MKIIKKEMQLTIVICTYNRGDILHHCLDGILRQTRLDAVSEVVVVNNNCSDGTSSVVGSYHDASVSFREVHELAQGLNNARNCGVRESKTEWIAFLDDDGRPHDTWVEAIIEFISAFPDAVVFGGPFSPYFHEPKPEWLPPEFGRFWQGENPVKLPHDKFWIAGGNMVVHKSVFDAIGLFDGRIGMRGKQLGYGGETFFYEKAISHGFGVYYAPKVAMDHLVRSDKFNLSWHIRSAYTRGMASMRRAGSDLGWVRIMLKAIRIPLQFTRGFFKFGGIPLKRRFYYSIRPTANMLGIIVGALSKKIRYIVDFK
jgi:glycosyltransferase involved in cell wall biosynthesis